LPLLQWQQMDARIDAGFVAFGAISIGDADKKFLCMRRLARVLENIRPPHRRLDDDWHALCSKPDFVFEVLAIFLRGIE
jgi:hypothetical protein